ncbi:hypothetical protein N7492_008598 [Penicillium capsulatum]|uniref:Uncharacterized protein n=1 Tax=Penicillium capsulatum TaxID=69766 RepID=A0A9W9HT14_9EURO|nr:hypothetical protein N7492_008598 [Penicillium capsulatum]KAJ6106003.1 hypothetical protein N7512_009520 [Penicillium capsulatum]
MASVSNIYTADPAYPTLACSLLTGHDASGYSEHTPTREAIPDEWNLQADWHAGVQSAKTNVFHSGKVIGFSRLKAKENYSNEYIAQIPRFLFTKHMLRKPPTSETTVFIIHPSNFDAFTPIILLNDLQSARGSSSLSREDAIRYLDTVQLLPVFDLQHASQAIAMVSESLQKTQEMRQKSNSLEKSSDALGPSVMLLVAGLDTLAEGVIRKSNPAKGTAVLAATLRSLTRMTRAHASGLSTILVNTNGLGAHGPPPNAANQTKPEDDEGSAARDDGVHSIFQMPGSTLLSNLLMRTLDEGIDTHILLSDVKSAQVAEVIKDRVGTGLGKWGIWGRLQ